jgi:hypothetical protein
MRALRVRNELVPRALLAQRNTGNATSRDVAEASVIALEQFSYPTECVIGST